MNRRPRKWHQTNDDDPGAGLLNLFDVWIAFAVALLLAIVSHENVTKENLSKQSSAPELESIKDSRTELPHYRPSEEDLGGDGQRLGTAYRLKSGEVIYVPDKETAPNTE